MPEKYATRVTWVKQKECHLCGPVVAQMILAALNVAAPAGGSWQEGLWEDVKAQTRAQLPRGGTKVGCCKNFAKQKCERCPNDQDHYCWCATPAALSRVLNLYAAGRPYKVISSRADNRDSADVRATIEILETIDSGLPAAVLVRGWQHWVVVEGYQHDEADSRPVGKVNLSGLYIRDGDENEALHFVKSKKWFEDWFSVVPCGGLYKNRCVVVGAKPSYVALAGNGGS